MKTIRNIVIMAALVVLGIFYFAPHTFMKKTPIGATYKVYRLEATHCICGAVTGYNAVAYATNPLGARSDSVILEWEKEGNADVAFDSSKIGTVYKVESAYADKKIYSSANWTADTK